MKGYTLMELLIVMTILVILAGFSYKAYQWHQVSVRRADGQLALLKLSSALENYYLQHNTYKGASLETMHFQDKSSQGFYQLTFTLQDEGQNYAAKAIPVGAQALQDKACGTLVLMTDGRRTYEGEDAKAECW